MPREVLILLNKFNIKYFIFYLIVGVLLWDFTHQSGIHATISGVLLALTIPHNKQNHKKSMLLKLEHVISPYVAFGIMPLFAFANAGVSLEGVSLRTLLNPELANNFLGLFFGKQIGVLLFSYISIKLNLAQMPNNSTWFSFYAVSILTGIGFTMSLFVGNLAFAENAIYRWCKNWCIKWFGYLLYLGIQLWRSKGKMAIDLILKIASDTKNYGLKNKSSFKASGKNKLCGDKITIELDISAGKIKRMFYETESCLFCQASASLLSKVIKSVEINSDELKLIILKTLKNI